MQVVEEIGPEVLEPLGRIGKGLFEPVAAEIDMADDLSLIRFEGRFTFCIERDCHGCRIWFPLGDGIAEELENIVLLPPLKTACAVLGLTRSIEMQEAAADNCQGSYPNIPPQARNVKQRLQFPAFFS